MNFDLNTEQKMLQDSVRRFVEQRYDFEKRMALLHDKGTGQADNWRFFAENGWLAAGLPEEFGGFGGGIVETVLIAQEFGRGLVVEPHLGCAVLGPQTLIAAASPQQQDRLLPLVATGGHRVALAYSEPQSRGMAEPVTLTAHEVQGGYRLNGRKTLVLGGAEADSFIVSAKNEEQVVLFLLDAGTPGIARTVVTLHDGSRAANLVFDDVLAPRDALLGDSERALPAVRRGLAFGTAALCGELVGTMERAIEITADYVRSRQQFGVPIGSFQVLQHGLADMATEMELARSVLFALLAAIEVGEEDAIARATSQAKFLVGQAAKKVCGRAIQLHGGIGMTEECAIGHYFKRAVVADILLGTSDGHVALLAEAGEWNRAPIPG